MGVLFLGDTTRHGLAGLAVLGFILAVVCAVALARFGEAGEQSQAGPGEQRPTHAGRSRATAPALGRGRPAAGRARRR